MGLTLRDRISVFRFIINLLYPKHNSYLLAIFVAIKYLIDTKRNIKYGNMNFHRTGFKIECLPREIHKSIVKIQINERLSDFHHQLIMPKSFFEDLYFENIYFRDKRSLWMNVKIIYTKSNRRPKVTQDYASNIKKIIKNNTSKLSLQATVTTTEDSPSYSASPKQISITERIVQIVPSFDQSEDSVYLSEHEYFNFVKPISGHCSVNHVILKFYPISDSLWTPQIADKIVLQMINIPVKVGTDLVDAIIEVYFSVPRFLHENDCFSIPLKEKFMGHLYFKYFSLAIEHKFLYFTCKNITKNSEELKSSKLDKQKSFGYFIIKGETEIIQEQNINSFIPFQKLLCSKTNIKLHSNRIEDFYVNSCPFGLNQYISNIESAILPFLTDEQASSILSELKCVIKPVFLVRGKAGSGRSLSISLLAMRNGLHLLKVNCQQLISTTAKQTEAKLDTLLQKAKRCSPVIVHLEDFEHFGVDSENKEDVRIIDSFKNSLNNLFEGYSKQSIIIFASCDVETELKPSLKRIFLDEFKIKTPNKSERLQLLHWMAITKNIVFIDCDISKRIESELCEATINDEKKREKNDNEILFKCVDGKQYHLNEELNNALLKVASKTETFVFDDLDSLMHLALRNAYLKFANTNENYFSQNNLTCKPIQEKDLEVAIATMHTIYNNKLAPLNIPKVEWEDIGGLDELKKEVFRTIELPLKFPHLMSNSGLKRSGILLWGPPGCGKTLVARAIASQLQATFLSVKGPELLDMYVGQSEKNMRDIFSTARSSAPCVIFFDEAEAVAGARGASGDAGGAADRLVSQLLAELDGVASHQLNSNSDAVIVVAATNRPDLVESALLRPGRLDKLLYIGPYKGLHDKTRVLKASCRGYKICDSIDLNTIAEHLPEKCTGADLAFIVNHAHHQALSKIIKKIEEGDCLVSEVSEKDVIISQDDFQIALSKFTPSISAEEFNYYESLKTRLS